MMIARWQIDARFGHKQAVIDMLADWARNIAPQIGWTAGKGRMLTGSIGAREATVVHEWVVADLARKVLGGAWQDRRAQEVEQGHGAIRGVRLGAVGDLSDRLKPQVRDQ